MTFRATTPSRRRLGSVRSTSTSGVRVEAAAAVVPDREAAEEGEPTTKLVAPVVAEEEGLAVLVVVAGAPVLMFIAVSLSILVRLTRCSSVAAVR